MLNIGKLSPGAANYYIGEIASSAEDYYMGHGESPGRWVGSLAKEVGLEGQVEEIQFRRVLDGKDPFTAEYLTTAQGSAGRAAARRPNATEAPARGGLVDALQVACQLGVSEQRVRQLLAVGAEAMDRRAAEEASGAEVSPLPNSYLVGAKAEGTNGHPDFTWIVPQDEVDRFAANHHQTKARPGYDLVLRPPKSVSILWALGDDETRATVRKAHREAVDQTVEFVESQAVCARSKGSRIATHGIIAAAFDHRTSRAGDPLLHTHVVTANMTKTVDDNWRALDGRPLFHHGRPGGAVYQAHMRHLLTRDLGVAWGPVVNGLADVAGIPRSVIEAFSKRRQEIVDLVAEAGLGSARAHQAATLASRQAKDYGVDPDTLQQRWRDEAEAAGFSSDDLAACLHRAEIHRPTQDRIEQVFDHLACPSGITERAASFDRGDVLIALAERLVADTDATELGHLADAFLASDRVTALVGASTGRQRTIVRDQDGTAVRVAGEERFTTPELLELERQVLGWAQHGFGTAVPKATGASIDSALASRPELSEEQMSMVRAVCSAADAVQPIVGRAGSGKTHALAACVEALAQSGVPVVGCSVSATAAARLEEATSMEAVAGQPCETVAKLLLELDGPGGGGFRPGTVCLVDEASSIGTRDLHRLAGHLQRAGGALKLVGDPDQLSSVDVGGAFRAIAASKGETLISLNDNHRQRDQEERLAVADYRQGRVAEALARYDAAGKVVRSKTAPESLDAMARDWYADRQGGIDEPMIAGPNALRRQLNTRARALLKADGTIAGPGLIVGGTEFCVGDEIVTRENSRRLRSPDRRSFIKNGSRGTVVEVDAGEVAVVVDFTREGRIRLPADYLQRGKVEHAYAQTNFLAQGLDQRRTKYHPTDSSRFEEGYVGVTRAIEETRIYIVDGARDHDETDLIHEPTERVDTGLDTIASALGQRGAQAMAHELDPDVAFGSAWPQGATLFDLRLARERVKAILAKAPAPVEHQLTAAVRTRDQLLTRRKLWEENRRQVIRRPEDRHRGRSRPASPSVERSEQELASVGRSLCELDKKIESLRQRDDERRDFFEQHQNEVEQLNQVTRAETSRELQVRVASSVNPPAAVLARAGSKPDRERQRVAWAHGVEEVAVYRERFVEPGTNADTGLVLGRRPTDPEARQAFDTARQAVERAIEVTADAPIVEPAMPG